jgi:hypothetical protein
MYVDDVKNKIKTICVELFGVENPSQSEEIKQKKKNTLLTNYGVEHALQSKEIKNNMKNNNILKFGVEYPMQNAEISEKSSKHSYKPKNFTFPCGNIIQVQGYEPFLLDILVKDGYTFHDIITSRLQVPEIWYIHNDKKRRYYCDMYIPKNNTIYEVKSTWTYQKGIEDIPLKKQACIDAGFNFELYIFNNKGIRHFLD